MATDLWMLFGGQVLNALLIAAVSGLGITYMQNMLPAIPGGPRTTVRPTRFPLGAMLAGPLFGLAQHFDDYRLAYWLATGLCAGRAAAPDSRYVTSVWPDRPD